jgi:hypothetical protein
MLCKFNRFALFLVVLSSNFCAATQEGVLIFDGNSKSKETYVEIYRPDKALLTSVKAKSEFKNGAKVLKNTNRYLYVGVKDESKFREERSFPAWILEKALLLKEEKYKGKLLIDQYKDATGIPFWYVMLSSVDRLNDFITYLAKEIGDISTEQKRPSVFISVRDCLNPISSLSQDQGEKLAAMFENVCEYGNDKDVLARAVESLSLIVDKKATFNSGKPVHDDENMRRTILRKTESLFEDFEADKFSGAALFSFAAIVAGIYKNVAVKYTTYGLDKLHLLPKEA